MLVEATETEADVGIYYVLFLRLFFFKLIL